MLSCLLPEDVWTWLVMLGIFMNSMSAEDSEPGCSGVATPATYQARNWTLGLWCVDTPGLSDSGGRLTTSVPQRMGGFNTFFKGSLLEELGKKHIKKNWKLVNINLHFGWNPKLAHTKLAEVFSPAPDSWSIGALCGPSGSGKSVNMRNLGCEAVLSHGMMESSGRQWQIGQFSFGGGQWQETVVKGKMCF